MTLGKLLNIYQKYGENNNQFTILQGKLGKLRQNFTTCKVLYNIKDYYYYFIHHSTGALDVVGAQ